MTAGILISMPSLTTIKVPMELRDRLSAQAREKGQTLAQFIAKLLREHETDQRYEELAEAIRKNPPAEGYFAELALWDTTLMDGMQDLAGEWDEEWERTLREGPDVE